MRRLRLAWLAPAFLLLSCKGATGVLPGWDDDGTSPPSDAVADADVPADSPGDAPADEPADASTDAPEAGDDAAAPAGETIAQATPAASAGRGGAGPGPLPKALHTDVDSSCGKDPGVGQRLKGFKLQTPDGKPISPGSYRGRVLLVNFWGTWCKPCLKELPEFDRLYRRYRKHGLTLLAVATDEDAAPVKEFLARKKIAAKVAIGGESYAGQYGSDKFPFSFVVDTKGVIKASYRGYKPECSGKLEADLRAELEKRNQ